MPSVTDIRMVETRIEAALSHVGWYRRCLEDVADGKVVRGLAEAEAGYVSALRKLASLAAVPDLEERA